MDDADITDERETALREARIREAAAAAAKMPPGEPGECELCGEWSGRLVAGACAPCRDRRRLP